MRAGQTWVNILLGVALAGFGVAQFATQHFLLGLLPFGKLPLYQVWVNLIAIILVTLGIFFLLRKGLRYATLAGSILFFLFFLYPHAVSLFADPYNGSKWTGTFECLSICSGILLVGFIQQLYKGLLPAGMGTVARYVFALCLLVFGIQHFLYAAFIATLIPGWLPAHLFWAYFVGVAFFASALSIFFGLMVRPAALLLALMFFLWALLLHAPRVAASPTIEPEWTSLFVALAMGAIAWQVSISQPSGSSAKVSG